MFRPCALALGLLLAGAPAVFAGGLITNMDDEGTQRRAVNAGGQLDLRLSVLSALEMTVSVGGAVVKTDEGQVGREAMVSLKILR